MRGLLNRLPLRWKIALLISVTTTIVVAISGLALYGYESAQMRQLLLRDYTVTAQMTGVAVSGALAFGDTKDAEETLGTLRIRQSVVRAVVYDKAGAAFVEFRRQDAQPIAVKPSQLPSGFLNDAVHVIEPITQAGDQIGTLYIAADLRLLDERLRNFVSVIAVLTVSAALFSFLLASVLQSAVSRPILGLSATAQQVARTKDFSLRAPQRGDDEIGQLIAQFNTMLEQIELQNKALQSAQSELERKVEDRTAELTRANQELEAFAYSVSHDLRAPLRHINGFVGLLEDSLKGKLDASAQDHLSEIRRSIESAGQLINDLLAFSRTSRAEMQMLRFNMSDLVEEVVRDAKREAADRAIEWRIATLPEVACDVSLLRQVWRNLVSNAMKYTRARAQARIEIGSEPAKGEAVFYIRDNGVGFDMRYADKLFGVFQRLHGAEFEGTGIGLANVRNIIARHGGRTWAKGAVNEGATFYFSLPDRGPEASGA